jgi:hypothetical protein
LTGEGAGVTKPPAVHGAILRNVTFPAPKVFTVQKLFFGAALLVVVLSAFFDLELQTGQEDAHLIYNVVTRSAVTGQSYYVAAPDHKGPLWMAVYSAALSLAGDGRHFWFVISAFCILLAIATSLCAWKLACIYGNRTILAFAVAFCVLFYLLLGNEDYTKVLFARNLSSFLIVASLALLTFIPAKNFRTSLALAFLSGSLTGLAVQTVESVAFVAPAVAAFLIFFFRQHYGPSFGPAIKALAVFIISSLLVCFSAAAWYCFRGVFSDFWTAWWTYNVFYVESKMVGPLQMLQRFAWDYFLYYRSHPFFSLIIFIFFLQLFPKKSKHLLWLDVLLLFWFIAEAISAASSQRFFENYMIQTYLPTAVMAIAMAARYGDRLKRNTQLLCGTAILAGVFFFGTRERFLNGLHLLSSYHGIESSTVVHLNDLAPEERDLRAFVQKTTSAHDFVYIWTTHPQLYSEVERVAAVRYLRYSWLIGKMHGGGGIHKQYVLPAFWQNWKYDIGHTTPVLIILTAGSDPPPADSALPALLNCAYSKVWHNSKFEAWKLTGDVNQCLGESQ